MSKGIISWKDILQAGDRESLDRRAERLSEILVEYKPVLHHRVKGPPSRAIDYRREAESSYVNGNFRSCIFSCAAIVDQVFRHEYVKAHEDKNTILKEIRGKKKGKKITFGIVINLIKQSLKDNKYRHMRPFVKKAKMLNEMRNTVAVHPAYVVSPLSEPWSLVKKINRDDILSLLKLLVKTDQKIKRAERKSMIDKILKNTKFSGLGRYGGRIPWFTLKEILDKNFDVGPLQPELVRDSIEDGILKPLALLSYKLMNEVVGGIYGIQKDARRAGGISYYPVQK